jgi:hypothetical protein
MIVERLPGDVEFSAMIGVGRVSIDATTRPIWFSRDFGTFSVSHGFTPANPALDGADFVWYSVFSHVYVWHE